MCRSYSKLRVWTFLGTWCIQLNGDYLAPKLLGKVGISGDRGQSTPSWVWSPGAVQGHSPGSKGVLSWSVSTYVRINFATTWKNTAPLKLLEFGNLTAAVYAPGLYTLNLQAKKLFWHLLLLLNADEFRPYYYVWNLNRASYLLLSNKLQNKLCNIISIKQKAKKWKRTAYNELDYM